MLENNSETLAEHSAGSRTAELQPEHRLGLRVTGVRACAYAFKRSFRGNTPVRLRQVLGGIMMHLSRATLLSTSVISLGIIVFVGSLTNEVISGAGAATGVSRAAAALSGSDFPICHTAAAAKRTDTVLRLAQTRTEVPPTEMKAAMPAPAFADSDPPLWDGLGSVTYKITTSGTEAQVYFDQGLRLAYAFNHGEAQRAFRKAQRLDPSCAMCFWGEALVLGPNINLPMQEDAVGPAFTAVQVARRSQRQHEPT